MGNCFAKNKLPGCFKLREDQGTVFFNQRNPIFSHYLNWVAPIPQSRTGGLPALAPRGRGPGAGLAAPLRPGAGSRRGLWGGRGHPRPTPRMLAAYHRGVFISTERGPERQRAMAPDLGAPGWTSCSRGGTWGGRGTRPHRPSFFYPSVFFPPKRNITVFETLSGGHFGEDAIFLCHVMLFPHLTLAALSQQPTAPTPTHPTLFSGAPAPGPGPEWLGPAGGWGGVPAIVHSEKSVGSQS